MNRNVSETECHLFCHEQMLVLLHFVGEIDPGSCLCVKAVSDQPVCVYWPQIFRCCLIKTIFSATFGHLTTDQIRVLFSRDVTVAHL